MSVRDEKCLHEVDRKNLFVPPVARSYRLAYLQILVVLQRLE